MGLLQVGIGPNYNYSELRSMASAPPSSNVIVSDDFSSLTDNLVFKISSLVCRSTSLNDHHVRRLQRNWADFWRGISCIFFTA